MGRKWFPPLSPIETYGETGLELRHEVLQGLCNIKLHQRGTLKHEEFYQYCKLPLDSQRLVVEYAADLFTLHGMVSASHNMKQVTLGSKNEVGYRNYARVRVLRALFQLFRVTKNIAAVVHHYMSWAKLVPLLVEVGLRLYNVYSPMEPHPVHCWVLLHNALISCFNLTDLCNKTMQVYVSDDGTVPDDIPPFTLSMTFLDFVNHKICPINPKVPTSVGELLYSCEQKQIILIGDIKDDELFWSSKWNVSSTFELLRSVQEFHRKLVGWVVKCKGELFEHDSDQSREDQQGFLLRLPGSIVVPESPPEEYTRGDMDSKLGKMERGLAREIPSDWPTKYQWLLRRALWRFWDAGIPFLPHNVFFRRGTNSVAHQSSRPRRVRRRRHFVDVNDSDTWKYCTVDRESGVRAKLVLTATEEEKHSTVYTRLFPENGESPLMSGEELELAVLLPYNWWNDSDVVGGFLADPAVRKRVGNGGPSVLWFHPIADNMCLDQVGVFIDGTGREAFFNHGKYWGGGIEPWEKGATGFEENLATALLLLVATSRPCSLKYMHTQEMVSFALQCRARGIGNFDERSMDWWTGKISAPDITHRRLINGRNDGIKVNRNLALLKETLGNVMPEFWKVESDAL